MTSCPSPRDVVVGTRSMTVRCACRSCPSCGVLWLGDTRIRTIAAARSLPGAVALVTVTAPGADLLPWDASGTRVAEWYARHWNETAPARWSALHRVAARLARAEARDLGCEWRLWVKTWEYQRRGVLHLHLLVPAGSAAQLAASTVYVNALAAQAGAHRFGFVDRGRLPAAGARQTSRELVAVAPERAAAYVASYVSSSGAGKPGIAEVAARQGVPGAIVYVSKWLTDRSGYTMRSLRARRRIACRYPGRAPSVAGWRAACLLDALERGRPPMTEGQRGALLAVATAQGWRLLCNHRTGETTEPTAAPSPPLSLGDLAVEQGPRTVGRVRLDLVRHHGHAWTSVSHVDTVAVA